MNAKECVAQGGAWLKYSEGRTTCRFPKGHKLEKKKTKKTPPKAEQLGINIKF